MGIWKAGFGAGRARKWRKSEASCRRTAPGPDARRITAASLPAIAWPGRSRGEEIAAARSYRAQAKAANTLRAYTSDWNQFEGWCDERSLDPLPARPEAVATYLASLALAGKADTTIGRHLAAIGWKHRQDGLWCPGRARRTHGHRRYARRDPPRGQSAAQRPQGGDHRPRIGGDDRGGGGAGHALDPRPGDPGAGLAAALRRSELVALEWRDVEMVDKGLKLTLRHSKTDQEGEGQVIAVPSGKTLKPVSGSRPGWRCAGGARGRCFTRSTRRAADRQADVGPLDRAADPEIRRGWGSIRRALGAIRCGPGSSPRRRAPGDHRQDAGGVAAQEGRSAAGLCSVS
jgi:hypothetical protein